MLSNKSICLIVALCGLIALSFAKPYGVYGQNYGYGFPSMYGGSGYGTMPGYHTKPYGYAGNNIGYGKFLISF